MVTNGQSLGAIDASFTVAKEQLWSGGAKHITQPIITVGTYCSHYLYFVQNLITRSMRPNRHCIISGADLQPNNDI